MATISTMQMQEVPAGIINPTTGRMMTDDKIAINRAIGPDQNDPPGRSLPAGPFRGGNPGGRGNPGGGPGHNNGGNQGTDKLVGNPPEVFKGIQAKAESFLTFWGIYAGINRENPAFANAYQRSLLFLTYIQGDDVAKWVQSMSC